VLNYTAVQLETPGLRVVDIANMRLTGKGALTHNSRHSHGLRGGEVHSCMIGGILRAFEGTSKHEQLETVEDVLTSVDGHMPYLGTLGFVLPKPSRPFYCTSRVDDITTHLSQFAEWFPQDTIHVEVLGTDNDRHILDYPEEKTQLDALLVLGVRSWEYAGDTMFISLRD